VAARLQVTYLSDVTVASPAFAVVPGSHRVPAVDPPGRGVPPEVKVALGPDYRERVRVFVARP
jgi:hypothetical protein